MALENFYNTNKHRPDMAISTDITSDKRGNIFFHTKDYRGNDLVKS